MPAQKAPRKRDPGISSEPNEQHHIAKFDKARNTFCCKDTHAWHTIPVKLTKTQSCIVLSVSSGAFSVLYGMQTKVLAILVDFPLLTHESKHLIISERFKISEYSLTCGFTRLASTPGTNCGFLLRKRPTARTAHLDTKIQSRMTFIRSLAFWSRRSLAPSGHFSHLLPVRRQVTSHLRYSFDC